jgi:hypothetical protein
MAKSQLSDLDFNGTSRVLNLPDAVGDQEPATFAQLKSQIEGLAWKDNVRVSTQSNINLLAPGATIDSVTMAINDRVLVPNQSSQPENGIYIWSGAAVPMTRAFDASTSDELENAVVTIDEGTSAGSSKRQQTVNFTIGVGNCVWGPFGTVVVAASESSAGIAQVATQAETDAGTIDTDMVTPLKLATYSGRKFKYSSLFGDGSATSYALNHNFATRDIHVVIYRNSGNYDEVSCDIEHTNTNTVTLNFAVAPTSNQYRAVVLA